ncbi:AIR synthase related protein [Nonomuraea endophytica]|uniref:AIR synthase related protein n=1 Tax=Nonomuraea endophytica TaxID=714136 RepID=UPI0037C99E48
MPQGPGVLLGPGDDAAVVTAPDGRVVVSTDLLVEGRHFRRDWSSGYDVGRKAAAQNLADIAAMGATPTSMVVALGMPADLPLSWIDELTLGFRDECALVGASVVGGDLARSDTVVIGVTALGTLSGQAPVTRSAAKAGHIVAISGRLGHAAAGLALLESGHLPTPPSSDPTPPLPTTPTPPPPPTCELTTPPTGSTTTPPSAPNPTDPPHPAPTDPASAPTAQASAPTAQASAPTNSAAPPHSAPAPTDPASELADPASASTGAASGPRASEFEASELAGLASGPSAQGLAPTDPGSASTEPDSSVPGVVGPGRSAAWAADSGMRGAASQAVVSGEALAEAGVGAAGVEGLLLEAVEGHRRPRPPYKSGPEAARLGASAMMDVSDGLLQDLGHIAKASGVRIVLDPAAFAVDEPVLAAAKELGADPLDWVLAGGEDHALVAVFPPEVRLPPEWRIVGRIEAGEGVTVTGRDDGPRGWDHFKG